MIYKLKFKLEYLNYYFKKFFPLFFLGIILGSLSFIYKDKIYRLINFSSLQPKIIGLSGLYTEKNLPEVIKNQISYGLTINSENDKPIPSPLIKSFEVSPNGKGYIFTLNNNLFWHNGKKFASYDINYQIAGISLKPLSPTRIQIVSDKDFSPLLSSLSRPIFLSNLVGLGSYQVNSVSYQDGFIKTLQLKPKNPSQKFINYRFYQNDSDLITAYKIGEVDEVEVSQLPPELTLWGNTKITQEIPTNQKYIAIFFNNEKLSNKQLRQSLAYATPKTTDQNERCLGPISASSWAYNPSIKEYNYSPDRAKELFGKNKIDGITLSVNDRSLLNLAESIKNSWETNLDLKTTISIENQIDNQNFEAVLAYGGIPHDPDQYLFWHSTQTKSNLTKLNNSRIDKLLEEGRQITNFQDRKKIYVDFQRYLLEESPAIFLSYPTTYTISRVK